ncbi:hypothetical protein [Leucobacter sp.]
MNVRIENHNRKVEEERRQAIIAMIVLAVIAVGAVCVFGYLFYFREGATGSGIPFLDEMLLNPAMVSA